MPLVAHTVYSGMGGIADVVFRLIEASSNSDYRHTIAFYGVEPLESSYATYCNEKGIDYRYFKRRRRVDWNANRALLNWIKSISPDAVFVHLPRTLSPALKYQRQNRTITVIGIEHHSNTLKRWIDWRDSQRLLKQASAVVYLTEDYKNQVSERYPRLVQRSETRVISNGINTRLFSPKNCDLSKNDTTVIKLGMCGRLSREKNIEQLCDMLLRIQKLQPEMTIRLSLAGTGDYEKELKKKSHDIGLSEQIDFVGFLHQDELVQWFRSLDIYTHSSPAETLSTAIMQAMSCGVPVIANNLPGMSTLISPNINGLLVDDHGIKQWCDKTLTLIKNPAKRKILGDAARSTILNQFSHFKSWESYKALVEETTFKELS